MAGPEKKMWEKTANDVMANGVHVMGGCFRDKGSHVHDVAGEAARFRAADTLHLHDPLDAQWGEPVT